MSSGEADLIHGMYREDSLAPPGKNAALVVQAAVSLAPASSILTNIRRLDDAALANRVAIRSLAFLVSPSPQHPFCVTATTYADCMHLNLLYD